LTRAVLADLTHSEREAGDVREERTDKCRPGCGSHQLRSYHYDVLSEAGRVRGGKCLQRLVRLSSRSCNDRCCRMRWMREEGV
jgi:hypothetical protein